MREKFTIGGHSRWFRLAVLLSVLFVLFASMLAVSAVDLPGSETGIGDGHGENSDQSDNSAQNDSSDSTEQDEQEPTNTSPSGASSYGGVSGGGYPEQSTVGGPLELSNRPELRIESPEPARWRLGGYDRYTGDGWTRDSDPEPLREPLGSESESPRYEIQVETLRPFRSLASVWRPASAEADQAVFVTDQQGLVVNEQLDTNETYVTSTYGPPSRSETGTQAGEVPREIQQQYTQLPSDTPDRLTEKTAEITADAETPSEAATAVKLWLQTNKQYSLDAGHDRGEDVATEFVFEMDAGYCQYFATAMTAMLRTQDIPARYVTGYTTGKQVEQETYLVRGKNAHAWVEVYLEDVGWVTFDPTPGGGRTDAGRSEPDQSQQDETEEDQNDSEQNDSEQEIPRPPYEITLSPDPVPGETVTVTVEKDESPVAGVEVAFNGETVGTTDSEGTVKATVPYATELTVSAAPPETTAAAWFGPVTGGSRGSAEHVLSAPRAPAQSAENSSVRYEIPTALTVETQDIVLPGRSVDANVSLNGSALSEVAVRVNGESVATTDKDGQFSFTVPANATLGESLTIRFERAEFTGEGAISVAEVEVEIEPGFLKLPGTAADVIVTAVDGDQEIPLEDVPIRTNGGGLSATTDDSGAAALILPWSNKGTATAVIGERTVTASVSGIYLHLVAVLAGVVVVLVGGAIWLRRHPEAVRRFKRGVVNTLITAGELLRRIGHGLALLPVALIRELRALLGGVRAYVARLRSGLTLAAIFTPARYLIGRVASLLAKLRSLPELIRGAPNDEATESDGSKRESETVQAYRRLRRCWRWLVRRVARRPRTKTAVEVEKQAVESGLPIRPVRRLRRAFQDVEYGYAGADERVDVAEESVEKLQDETDEAEQ